jgi:asparagine synthase (glutamine-hydrolysing)
VLHAAQRVGTDGGLRAFTSVYPAAAGHEADERRWATLAASRYDDVALEPVEATGEDWIDVLTRIVWHMDGPGYSPAVFPLWKIMEHARASGVPVLLEGQGGDELLAGYGHHAALALLDSLRASVRRPSPAAVARVRADVHSGVAARSPQRFAMEFVAEAAPGLKRPYWRYAGALAALRPGYVSFARDAADEREPQPINGGGYLEARLIEDFSRRVLPGFLHYGDAIAMAHSVENRLPLLDHRLVDFCFRLPARTKVRGGETKRVLRDYLRRAGQEAIAERRDKCGYPTPAQRWLAADGGALPRELLLGEGAQIHRYASPRRLERLIDMHTAGRGVASEQLYRLVGTELWLRKCVAAGS